MMPPGLLVGALRSGSGKTTIALGLMQALKARGVAVAAVKCGPDYIDPAFHAVATGRPSLNLDSWAMPPALLGSLGRQAGLGAELVIAEGLMGLFDGVPGPVGRTGSSADVAAAFGWPLLLVLDVSGQAQSAAAIVHGVRSFDPRLPLAGVILNKVGSERHRRLAAGAITALGVPVFGAVPRQDGLVLPERHLGLVQAGESADLDEKLAAMGAAVAAHVDLDAVRSAARAGPSSADTAGPALPPPGRRIALAADAAFSFVYPHVVAGWRAAGAELVPFSPLGDEPPPDDCDACWLPGGYPELHAARLASAGRFLAGLRAFAETRPVHGECGGYMVLGEAITDADGVRHPMAGLLGVETSFARRKLHLGYRRASLPAASPFGPAGTVLTGHEFHYASIIARGDDAPFASVGDAHGGAAAPDGSRRGHVSGSFFHAIAALDREPADGDSAAGSA
ncbi:cobyrinate a,c-diamide synthase [Methylobrevis albus]|uniref:Hydrogenobyrinate a,c-diamide synthase n=1 Tax=Methylobrevis albus TaxID=2793297 RepID=A0A931MXS3_9HYPH|nr:cobyrinate a,c-diamide synthase [Methylobrevis albus]MBH0236289.1 cobyrinate a,c-diamide synthase [Methylobrevis albus]